MKDALAGKVSAEFNKKFATSPRQIVLSPGRINIIGEHVDYNDGFVLPAAIDKYACFAISESGSDQSTIHAIDLDDSISFSLLNPVKPSAKMWANYLLGVLHQLQLRNLPVRGFNMVFSSDVPSGAGLSSSAALECGFGFAVDQLYKLNISRSDIALMGQKAEHTFVGVNCGIMDQFASVFGKKDKVIRLDCTTLEHEYHNGDFGKYSLLLFDSRVKHTHLTSGYNDRRRDCEAGLAIVKTHFPEVRSFRDCSLQHLKKVEKALGDLLFKRCSFVVREIERVNQAVIALDAGQIKTLGRLMHQTHIGLSVDYEVSCEELDFLVRAAMDNKAVAGSRMMGGGFGGCTINLVEKGCEDELIKAVSAKYKTKFNIELTAYKVKISDGTHSYEDPGVALRGILDGPGAGANRANDRP